MEGCGGGGGEGGFVWVMRRGGVMHCEVLGCIIDFCFFAFSVFLGLVEGWDRFGIRGKGAWDWFCYVFTLFFFPFVGGFNLYSSVLFFSFARKHGLSLPLERIFCSFLHMEAVPTGLSHEKLIESY